MENNNLIDKLKRAIRYDFNEIKRLVPEIFLTLKGAYDSESRLT